MACFNAPLTLRRADALPPSIYVQCVDKPDGAIFGAVATRLRARGCDVRTLPTGHFCMLTMPCATTALLDEIGRSEV